MGTINFISFAQNIYIYIYIYIFSGTFLILCYKNYLFIINPLNAQLNHICHLLVLLQAHHIYHVSGVRVKKSFFPPKNKKWVFNSLHCHCVFVFVCLFLVLFPFRLFQHLIIFHETCNEHFTFGSNFLFPTISKNNMSGTRTQRFGETLCLE